MEDHFFHNLNVVRGDCLPIVPRQSQKPHLKSLKTQWLMKARLCLFTSAITPESLKWLWVLLCSDFIGPQRPSSQSGGSYGLYEFRQLYCLHQCSKLSCNTTTVSRVIMHRGSQPYNSEYFYPLLMQIVVN